jgi:hypothetical protein
MLQFDELLERLDFVLRNVDRDELLRLGDRREKRRTATFHDPKFEDVLSSRAPEQLDVSIDVRSRFPDNEPIDR